MYASAIAMRYFEITVYPILDWKWYVQYGWMPWAILQNDH
jgi:hypothetical protein